MKTDINLLQKRKVKQYSAKKLGLTLLAVFLFAGAAYAGFMFPNNARIGAKLASANLDSELLSVSGTEEDTSELTALYKERSKQLEAFKAIDEAKTDMSEYMDAIESSLPTSINLTYVLAAEETIGISGEAKSDGDIAAFCLHLRETGKFREVFLTYSQINEDENLEFDLDLILPVTLSSSSVLSEQSEETDAAQETTAPEESGITEEATP